MRYLKLIGLAVLMSFVASCTTSPSEAEKRAHAVQILQTSFKTRGIASVERLKQDETQALCSRYPKDLPAAVAKKIVNTNLQLIRYPADGKLLGDWKAGEKIAQTGRGLQFSDKAGAVNGGNCYACHRLAPQEVSYGTIGPSLYNYGKQRGNGPEVQKYTYGKIYNSQAFAACSNMPRFGHNQILTEAQIKDVVALLLDPDSPVNK